MLNTHLVQFKCFSWIFIKTISYQYQKTKLILPKNRQNGKGIATLLKKKKRKGTSKAVSR